MDGMANGGEGEKEGRRGKKAKRPSLMCLFPPPDPGSWPTTSIGLSLCRNNDTAPFPPCLAHAFLSVLPKNNLKSATGEEGLAELPLSLYHAGRSGSARAQFFSRIKGPRGTFFSSVAS